jgi:hypothetical protein
VSRDRGGAEVTRPTRAAAAADAASWHPAAGKRGAQPGEKHRDWNGGRIIDKDGYALILMPDHPAANHAGYIREHRLVMEEYLGRLLGPEEVVHHKNGDKRDNRIENLEVFASNAEHLASTLKGKVPQWTPEGTARMGKRKREPVVEAVSPTAVPT